jgi:hypothetical protein
LRDKLGTEIKVNDYIVYAHNLGRSAALKFGRVIKLSEKPTIHYESLITEYRIGVLGYEEQSWNKEQPYTLTKGTLQYPDRVVVLSTLPPEIKKALDGL